MSLNIKNPVSGIMTNAGILVKMANPNDRPDNKNNKIPILSLFLFKRLLEIIASNMDKTKNGNSMKLNNFPSQKPT